MRQLIAGIAITSVAAIHGASAQDKKSDMFIIRDTSKSQEQVANDIRTFVKKNEWLHLAEFGLLGGKVTAVKICYPPIAKDIVAAGMHTMAMMPCGHIALYEEGGQTRLSMLHPRFMPALYPDKNLEEAVRKVEPEFQRMLDQVLK